MMLSAQEGETMAKSSKNKNKASSQKRKRNPSAATQLAEKAQEIKESKGPAAPKSVLGKIVGGLGTVGKIAGPLLSMINPVAGAAVSKVSEVISNNDPEWYEEYKSAGVTTNELLASHQTTAYGYNLTDRIVAAKRNVVNINSAASIIGVAYPAGKESDTLRDLALPSILADVRKATNNVLADDTQAYWEAYRQELYLYEVYYAGKKLLEYSEHLPLNVPQPTQMFPAISPVNISQFRGIIESLGHYLKSTVRLPYALTAYTRWRFGTMFLSDQSERTGIISYSPIAIEWRYKDSTLIPAGGVVLKLPLFSNAVDKPSGAGANTLGVHLHTGDIIVNGAIEDTYHTNIGYNLETLPLEAWISSINRAYQRITTFGRAPADLKVAYDSHAVDYSVDARHFDAKEANVRSNASYYGVYDEKWETNEISRVSSVANKVTICMNSELAPQEGIQSLAMSTVIGGKNTGDASFFPLAGRVVASMLPLLAGCFYYADDADTSDTNADVTITLNADGTITRRMGAGCRPAITITDTESSLASTTNGSAYTALSAGGVDNFFALYTAHERTDGLEQIIRGGGGTEIYSFFLDNVQLKCLQEIDEISTFTPYALALKQVGVKFNAGYSSPNFKVYIDGQQVSLPRVSEYTVPAGWHSFSYTGNFIDMTQVLYQPAVGYFNCKVRDGVLEALDIANTPQGQYCSGVLNDTAYFKFPTAIGTKDGLPFGCWKQLHAKLHNRESIGAEIGDSGTETTNQTMAWAGGIYNIIPVSSSTLNMSFYRCIYIANALSNEMCKQLEIFNPGAGLCFSGKMHLDTSIYSGGLGTVFLTGLQAYDYATITPEQIAAIHRTATRNLIRFGLKQKTGLAMREEVKESVGEILNAAGAIM